MEGGVEGGWGDLSPIVMTVFVVHLCGDAGRGGFLSSEKAEHFFCYFGNPRMKVHQKKMAQLRT